jgi:fibronectin-binding autotransporter adhesin
LNIQNVTTNNAATNIIAGPGRLGILSMTNLGVSGQPLVLDGGVLRFVNTFPIATYSNVTAFSAVHPVIFPLNKNVGFDNQNNTAANQTFTVDVPLALGTGGFIVEGNGGSIVVATNTGNNYSGPTLLIGANLQINDAANIGTATAPIYFIGALKITGTGMTNLGTRPVVIGGGRSMQLNIDDASNVFTVGQLLTDNVASNGIPLGALNDVAGICGVSKTGLGTLVLAMNNTYSGLTTVGGGTLVVGTNALSLANGALGNTNTEVSLGVASLNTNASILIGGAFEVGRNIRTATANTTDAGTRVLTLGGNTAHNSIFSGNIFLGTASQAGRGVTLTAASGGQVTFSGVIQNPGSMDATTYTVTKSGLGTVILANTNTYTGATTVSAGTLLVNGSIGTNTLTVQANATLGGTGTIKGVVTIANGGTLAPGTSIGTLTNSNNLVLGAGSTNTFEVDGSGPANDQVVLGAGVTYGGALNIVPSGTFTAGQTFTLFSGTGATNAGNFSSPILGSPGAGLAFSFTNGVLSVNSTISEPAPATLTNSYSGGLLTLTWPAGEGWVLKNQTNSLSTGLNPATNAWFTVPGGIDGSNSITIDPTQPTVFYRLVWP